MNKFISPQGSDGNSGDQNAPWKTLTYGVKHVTAGDTLFLRGGNYNEVLRAIYGAVGVGKSFAVPITIKAYSGEPVTWIGSGDYIFGPESDSIPTPRSFYWILQDLTLDGANGGNFPIGGNAADHIRFQNVEVRNAVRTGILVGGNGWELLNVHSHHNGSISNQDHGVYAGWADAIIEGGSYHDNQGYGVHVYGQTGSTHRNIVRGVRIFDNNRPRLGGGGLIISSGVDNAAYNCLIYRNGGYGASIGESGGATTNKLFNNTVYGNDLGMLVGAGAAGSVVRNNISVNRGSDYVDQGTGTVQSNNWLTANGDPLFVDAPNGDFRLKRIADGYSADSPCLDAAQNLSAIFTDDFLGNQRPLGRR